MSSSKIEQNLELFKNSASTSVLKDTVVVDHVFNPYVDRGYILPQLMQLQEKADLLGVDIHSTIGIFYSRTVMRTMKSFLKDQGAYNEKYDSAIQRLERRGVDASRCRVIPPLLVDSMVHDATNSLGIDRPHLYELLTKGKLSDSICYSVTKMLKVLYNEAIVLMRLYNNDKALYDERSQCYSPAVYKDMLFELGVSVDGGNPYVVFIEYYEEKFYGSMHEKHTRAPRRRIVDFDDYSVRIPKSVIIAFLKTGAYYGIQNAITFMGMSYHADTLEESRIEAEKLLKEDSITALEHEIRELHNWIKDHSALYKDKYDRFISYNTNCYESGAKQPGRLNIF